MGKGIYASEVLSPSFTTLSYKNVRVRYSIVLPKLQETCYTQNQTSTMAGNIHKFTNEEVLSSIISNKAVNSFLKLTHDLLKILIILT